MPIATISVNFASLAEVQAGTATAKSINPSNLKSALQSGSSMYAIHVATLQSATTTQVGTDLTVGAFILNAAGSLGAPSYTFTGDLDTGIYRPSADTLGLVS